MAQLERLPIRRGLRTWLLLAMILPLAFAWLSPAAGQEALPPPEMPPVAQAHPKLETVLQLLAESREAGVVAAQAFAQAQGIELADDAVRVVIEPLGRGSLEIDRAALERLGATVEATSRSLMRARIPLAKLIAVADTVGGVRFIRRPYTPRPAAVTSEGVALTGASAYHSAGYYGQNTKVAVIDLGFIGLSGAIANGEFGSGSGYGGSAVIDAACTKDYTLGGLESNTSHGTAVAEIVHDMAPQATLCLMRVGDEVDLENAKDDAIYYGVDIVSHSVGWYNTNFYDGTGSVAEAAADARDHNILWVNAAGNFADPSRNNGHWQGSFVDGNGNRWHDFATSDECDNFNASAGEMVEIYLTWDAWPNDPQDYDLFLYNASQQQVASSVNRQSGTQPPMEKIAYNVPSAGSYCFSIYDYNAPSHPALEVFIFKSTNLNLEYSMAASSIPAPGNSAKVLTVGAIYRGNWTTGPQESYSSQGPTNASKYASSRTKPDLMGPDGVSTYTYGGSYFYGTSASAPHVAGAAALLLSENPGRTANDLQAKLEADAVDMGAAGKDNIYGSGRLSLLLPAGTEAAFRVTREGDVYADRAYFCGLSSGCFQSGSGADIAELISTSEPVTPGDLVELDPARPGHYRKASRPYSTLVAGVISSAPGIVMGGGNAKPGVTLPLSLALSAAGSEGPRLSIGSIAKRHADSLAISLEWTVAGVLAQLRASQPLLALIGVVPVKASTENGPIRPGDLLVSSSTPGHVMRCGELSRCEGAIVGKALEPLEEGQGLIRMLVMQ
ncbi:MAG: S8 family serine peptidase [Candidatus Acetothermia bacterium]|nr:S8 family serine peptidase [Candidatus Acetothermia bacterium]